MGGRASPDAKHEPPQPAATRRSHGASGNETPHVPGRAGISSCSHLAPRPLRMLLKQCAIDPGEHND